MPGVSQLKVSGILFRCAWWQSACALTLCLLLPVSQSLGVGLLGVAACVMLVCIVALAVTWTKQSCVEPKV